MIYEHAETGLRVVVKIVDRTEEYRTRDGKHGTVVTGQCLVTDAGQPCRYIQFDGENWESVEVGTGRATLILRRVS